MDKNKLREMLLFAYLWKNTTKFGRISTHFGNMVAILLTPGFKMPISAQQRISLEYLSFGDKKDRFPNSDTINIYILLCMFNFCACIREISNGNYGNRPLHAIYS